MFRRTFLNEPLFLWDSKFVFVVCACGCAHFLSKIWLLDFAMSHQLHKVTSGQVSEKESETDRELDRREEKVILEPQVNLVDYARVQCMCTS